MNIAHKPKYELIQIQKRWGGPSLTQPNATAMKANAKPSEAAPEILKNHLSEAPRSVCAPRNANAPTLTAISTKSRETGRKLKGPLTSGAIMPISPYEPSPRPCKDRSHELPAPTGVPQAHSDCGGSRHQREHAHIPDRVRQRQPVKSRRSIRVQHQKVQGRTHGIDDAA